jgi:GTP-binding protein
MPLPVVAIVGRPNVGKSTLFNRIIGFRKSVVHDRPGVTRDRLYEQAEAFGRKFLLIDTGGIEPDPNTELLAGMRRQVMVALEEAHLILFLVDGRSGLTPGDTEVADLLRRTDKPIVLAVNKLDGPKQDDLTADFWTLGLDSVLPISSEHGRGIYELPEAVVERLPAGDAAIIEEELPEDQPAAETDEVLGLHDVIPATLGAVIGRPNVGKSTLMNKLLGEDRHLVHDMPGTTMDPVDSPLEVGGRHYVLVDTAGVRRKSKIDDVLERWVSLRAIESI